MSQLEQQLLLLGINHLSIDVKTRHQLDQFIAASSAHFDHICQQRPEKPLLDLLLGFMTLHHQQAQQQWLHQRTTTKKMNVIFNDTLGDNFANKFINQDQDTLLALTHLWLMLQGASGIHYSYSNEQAEIQCQMIIGSEYTQFPTKTNIDLEALRCQFMQSYYLGKNHNKSNFICRIKQRFRKV